MRNVLVCVLAALLAGCGMIGPTIMKHDSLAFNDVIEDATNKLLVLNVLRARDKAPLHFADIPVIRESMQQNLTLSAIDVSGQFVSTITARNSRTGGLGMQFTPSFEVTHLQSKEFHTGIATPIDPRIVKYWLDRGLDRRIVLLLFFSSAEIIETASPNGPRTSVRIMNSPREAVDVIMGRKVPAAGDLQRCDTQSDFERYLKLINALKSFFAHSYRERRLLASGLNLEPEKDPRALQSFAALDQTKTQLVFDQGTRTYSLYAVSGDPRIAFCMASGADGVGDYMPIAAGAGTAGDRQGCFQPVVEVQAEDSTRRPQGESPLAFPGPRAVTEPSRYCAVYNRFVGVTPPAKPGAYPRLELRLHMRSVGEIFQFLGDMLHYQDEVKRHLARNPQAIKLNTPVTFGYCPDDPSAGCDDVFIQLDAGACNARFAVSYRDREYHVANFSAADESCGPQMTRGKDHTLEILSVLHQLVGLHRSAADIRATPAVQVLP